VVRFDGFLKVYEVLEDKKEDDDESANKLPNLDNVKRLELEKLDSEQHFTQPPPRYNEASLVKELEERGIGRPSTYASIINTIQDREYATKISGRFLSHRDRDGGLRPSGGELSVYLRHCLHGQTRRVSWTRSKRARKSGPLCSTASMATLRMNSRMPARICATSSAWRRRQTKSATYAGRRCCLKWGKFGSFYACSAYNKKDKSSCTFTKENTAGKPDLNTPEGQEASRAGGVLR
jgi:DNA topoisomerase-1